jgi:hypothetical protein
LNDADQAPGTGASRWLASLDEPRLDGVAATVVVRAHVLDEVPVHEVVGVEWAEVASAEVPQEAGG